MISNALDWFDMVGGGRGEASEGLGGWEGVLPNSTGCSRCAFDINVTTDDVHVLQLFVSDDIYFLTREISIKSSGEMAELVMAPG